MRRSPEQPFAGQEITTDTMRPLRDAAIEGSKLVATPPLMISDVPGGGKVISLGRKFRPRGIFDNQPTIGAASEGTETADTTTWDRDAQVSGELGVRVYMLSRVVYNDAGDETLYAFVRYFDYDHLGHLKYISAETRVSVDVAEGC